MQPTDPKIPPSATEPEDLENKKLEPKEEKTHFRNKRIGSFRRRDRRMHSRLIPKPPE